MTGGETGWRDRPSFPHVPLRAHEGHADRLKVLTTLEEQSGGIQNTQRTKAHLYGNARLKLACVLKSPRRGGGCLGSKPKR